MNFKYISNKQSDLDSPGKLRWCESVANVTQLAMWYSNNFLSIFCLK